MSEERSTRDAERLQAAIDRLSAGTDLDELRSELADDTELPILLTLAARSQEVLHEPAPAPMRARQQAALQATFERTVGGRRGRFGRGLSPLSNRPRLRLLARLAAVLVAIGLACGSAVVAAADSLPGDALYGVKLVAEEARLLIARSASARAALRLAYASERLDEIDALIDRGVMPPAAAIDSLIDAWHRAADEAATSGSAELTARADDEIARGIADLRRLGDQVDDDTRGLIEARLANAPLPGRSGGNEPPPTAVGGTGGDAGAEGAATALPRDGVSQPADGGASPEAPLTPNPDLPATAPASVATIVRAALPSPTATLPQDAGGADRPSPTEAPPVGGDQPSDPDPGPGPGPDEPPADPPATEPRPLHPEGTERASSRSTPPPAIRPPRDRPRPTDPSRPLRPPVRPGDPGSRPPAPPSP